MLKHPEVIKLKFTQTGTFKENYLEQIITINPMEKIEDIFLDDSEIDELIRERNLARKKKEFKKADEIRLKLKSLGIMIEDRKEGTIWKRED